MGCAPRTEKKTAPIKKPLCGCCTCDPCECDPCECCTCDPCTCPPKVEKKVEAPKKGGCGCSGDKKVEAPKKGGCGCSSKKKVEAPKKGGCGCSGDKKPVVLSLPKEVLEIPEITIAVGGKKITIKIEDLN